MTKWKLREGTKPTQVVYDAAMEYASLLFQRSLDIQKSVAELCGTQMIESTDRPVKENVAKAGRGAGKRVISADGRRRIAEAQKKRWAAHRGQA